MPAPGVPIAGAKLYAARVARRMTTSALASAVGCSRGHIRYLERGLRPPSLELLAALERVLHVRAADLGADLPKGPPVRTLRKVRR